MPNSLDFDSDEDEVVGEENEAFTKAANYLQQNVSAFDQQNLLEFYGLYKQALTGPCNTPKPSMFNLRAKAQWNAWNNLGSMNKSKAMGLYVKKLKIHFPDVDLGEGQKSQQQWVTVSSMLNPDDEQTIPDSEKSAFDFVKESNLDSLKIVLKIIKAGEINDVDVTGLGLIHWAADRGNASVLQELLESGANIDLQDSDGQTALHYAASCGNLECIKVLTQFKADFGIRDSDNKTCFDVALDDEILECLKS